MQKALVAVTLLLVVLFVYKNNTQTTSAKNTVVNNEKQKTLNEQECQNSLLAVFTGFSFFQMKHFTIKNRSYATSLQELEDAGCFNLNNPEMLKSLKQAFLKPSEGKAYQGYFFKFLKVKDSETFVLQAQPSKPYSKYHSYFLNQKMLIYKSTDNKPGLKNYQLIYDIDAENKIEKIRENLSFVAEKQMAYFVKYKTFADEMDAICRILKLSSKENILLLLAFCHEDHPLSAQNGYLYSMIKKESKKGFYILAFPELPNKISKSYLMNELLEIYETGSEKKHRHFKKESQIDISKWSAVTAN
jgi:hypothetical protein